MLVKLLAAFALYCALLYVLSKLLKDFYIRSGAIPVAALVLLFVNLVVGFFLRAIATALNVLTLGIVKWLLQLITLGLFGLIVSFIFNLIIFWLADKLSDRIHIRSVRALLFSAAALQFSNYVLGKLL
ncbi:MAG: phage holin family protein [Turneriella sp.]|nr:phage holin family protein [Turneriella sp.]